LELERIASKETENPKPVVAVCDSHPIAQGPVRGTHKLQLLPEIGTVFEIDGRCYRVSYVNVGKVRFSADPA